MHNNNPELGVNFGEAIRYFFQQYAYFRGRSTRAEFWYMQLLNVMVTIVLSYCINNLAPEFSAMLSSLWLVGTLIPYLALAFRRLHDIGKSAWFLLWALLPIIGWLILMILFARPSDADNRYGETLF